MQLLELYTSQSCSSCPPAESWYNHLKTSPGLWKTFIPLSYHVAYWNHLSWKDPFSKEEFSQRQKTLHRVIQGGVYTPQIVLSGEDYRDWASTKSKLPESTETPGNLNVNINESRTLAKLEFKTSQSKDQVICNGAYIESGHSMKVTAGENEGRKIKQDFVVIELFEGNLKSIQNGLSCSINMKFDQKRVSKEKGLVFWLTDKTSYRVIQASGGPIK